MTWELINRDRSWREKREKLTKKGRQEIEQNGGKINEKGDPQIGKLTPPPSKINNERSINN